MIINNQCKYVIDLTIITNLSGQDIGLNVFTISSANTVGEIPAVMELIRLCSPFFC